MASLKKELDEEAFPSLAGKKGKKAEQAAKIDQSLFPSMAGAKPTNNPAAQGPTLMQMMAEQTKQKLQVVPVNQGKKKRSAGGVKAS